MKVKLKVSFTELLYNLMELLMNRPEFVVKSTDIKHPIRAAFIKVLQDYDGGISKQLELRL
jgi:hypothetical protein